MQDYLKFYRVMMRLREQITNFVGRGDTASANKMCFLVGYIQAAFIVDNGHSQYSPLYVEDGAK